MVMAGAMVASACGVAGVTTTAGSARSTPSQQTGGNRLRAVSAAEQLLRQLVLPPGAHRISKAPSGDGKAFADYFQAYQYLIASQVDRHAFWQTTTSPYATVKSIEAHLPEGAKPGQIGEGGTPEMVSYVFAAYPLPAVNRRFLGARQLVLVALTRPGGGSIIGVDANVRYIAPRPYDERIPGQARVLEITVGSNLPRPRLSLMVTNVSEVSRIAGIIDALPFVRNRPGPGVVSCPAYLTPFPVDRFVFRAALGGPVLAKLTEPADTLTVDDPCDPASLTIRGRNLPPLEDGGILLKQAGALLDARLSCTTKLVRVPGSPGHRSKEEVQCSVR